MEKFPDFAPFLKNVIKKVSSARKKEENVTENLGVQWNTARKTHYFIIRDFLVEEHIFALKTINSSFSKEISKK